MIRDLKEMEAIQSQKAKDMAKEELHPLDPEGDALAEHKRFTFDIIDTPADPLR